ncbi:MAG: hypothetical protein LPK09_03790 [Hymenobacteraceae bacterium]|nr:hypothetical protein [Hymenobacteraceae bacterium]
MKRILLIMCCFSFFTGYSQENKITELLNKQLNAEIKEYNKADSLKVTHSFHINESKKLVLEVEKYNRYMERWEVIKSEAPLDKITGFVKDINVIFLTDGYQVLTTTKTYDLNRKLLRTDVADENMFFTQIFEEKDNQKFRDKIVSAFKKAGYKISSEHWYD